MGEIVRHVGMQSVDGPPRQDARQATEAAAANAISSSCWPVPPLTPIPPSTTPPILIGALALTEVKSTWVDLHHVLVEGSA
jgi:hypothetical protein